MVTRPTRLVAHTPPVHGGDWHYLDDHLLAVANAAREHAGAFGAGDLAWWAGILHDAGKASPEFQDYLWKCATEPNRKHPTVDHKGAGVLRSMKIHEPLAVLIQGHHGGLLDAQRLLEKRNQLQARSDQLANVLRRYDELGLPNGPAPELPAWSYATRESFEFFLRMLFSALVDADHADTEQHWNPEDAGQRGHSPSVAELWSRYDAEQSAFAATVATRPDADSVVNRVRREVYNACLEAADLPPGLFRLTVPTGGGKTRSVLGFALKHAWKHGLRRVITAVPYLTITDQTAAVYRGIFADDYTILEHHSAAGAPHDDELGVQDPHEAWRRLAAQDWDAPLIVTTMVQLLESLLGHRTTVCRKLHRIAGSVIILDEAQTIPVHLRGPIFDVLRELVANYRVTVVLCTATQPALDTIGDKLAPHEIAPDPPRLFRMLERVRYQFPDQRDTPWTWDQVSSEMLSQNRALCVLNTVAQAHDLFLALGDDDAHFHLSTRMCGAHRRDVLAEVRRRLRAGEPCRLVSTQVIEAGVDVDFPLLLRAMGPLDRIVQAAGRCNREGRLDGFGRVIVFEPAEGGMPSGAYRTGADETRIMMNEGAVDLNDPSTFARYFRRLYGSLPADRDGIQASRARHNYETVSEQFKLIDDDSISVLVRYHGAGVAGEAHHAEIVADLISEIEQAALQGRSSRLRALLIRAQPYLVNVRRTALGRYASQGLATELTDGLWRWDGGYDERRGLVDNRIDVDALFI